MTNLSILQKSEIANNEKLIGSLALINSFWNTEKEYIDIFIPFLATLINKKEYCLIEPKQLCYDFKE
jgi:hypothetical protein